MRFSPLRSLAPSPSSRVLTLPNTGRSASTSLLIGPVSVAFALQLHRCHHFGQPGTCDSHRMVLASLSENYVNDCASMKDTFRTRHSAPCTRTGSFTCRSRQEYHSCVHADILLLLCTCANLRAENRDQAPSFISRDRTHFCYPCAWVPRPYL
ncbi:hypothetical protein EDB89DRAFT_279636 [Lactarius sanguifluus]|nr:hypothetical protein EDB89DRAFT_279636 [Lactarius sanguifluus]